MSKVKIPDDWRDAIVIKIRERHGVLGWQAHMWLDDVLEKGVDSQYFHLVAPPAKEFIGPIWDAVVPSLMRIAEAVGVALSGRAENIIAGTDE